LKTKPSIGGSNAFEILPGAYSTTLKRLEKVDPVTWGYTS
jgi:hypothetical protein